MEISVRSGIRLLGSNGMNQGMKSLNFVNIILKNHNLQGQKTLL